jgi:hypothetical protein
MPLGRSPKAGVRRRSVSSQGLALRVVNGALTIGQAGRIAPGGFSNGNNRFSGLRLKKTRPRGRRPVPRSEVNLHQPVAGRLLNTVN